LWCTEEEAIGRGLDGLADPTPTLPPIPVELSLNLGELIHHKEVSGCRDAVDGRPLARRHHKLELPLAGQVVLEVCTHHRALVEGPIAHGPVGHELEDQLISHQRHLRVGGNINQDEFVILEEA
jgi:hypothetical protein